MDHATDSGLPHHIQNQLIYAAMRGTLNQNGSTTPQEGQSGLQDIDGQLMQLLGQQYPAIPVPSPVSLPSGAQLDEDDDSSGDDEGSDFGMTDESFEDQAYEPTTARERRDASRPHRPRKSSVHSINSVSTSASFDESSMGPNAMASEYTVTTDDPDRPYQCQYPNCGRRFTRRADCLRHVKIHLDERPFACPDCPKRFIQRHALVVHMRKHTGERPFACDLCDRKFTESSSLTRHRRIHTQERPFGCHICNKHFTRKSTLQRHVERHGLGEPMNDFDDESDTDERLSSVSAERSPVFATVGGTPTHMQAGRGRRAPAPMQIRLDTLDLGPSASSATTFSATSLSSASEVPTIRVIPEELPAALRQQQQQQNRASRGPRSPNSLSPTSIGFRAKPTLPARPAFPAAGRTSTSGTASALYRGFVVPHIHDQGHDHAHDHGHDALAHGRGIPLPHTTLLFAGQPAPGAEFDLESVLHGHTPHDHTYNPLTHPFTHDDFLPPPAARERSRSAPNFGLDIQRLALAMATNPNFTLGLDLATTLAGGALGGGFDAMPAVGNNFHQPAELSVPAMATPPILSKGIEDWENELFDVTGQQGLG